MVRRLQSGLLIVKTDVQRIWVVVSAGNVDNRNFLIAPLRKRHVAKHRIMIDADYCQGLRPLPDERFSSSRNGIPTVAANGVID
jgi:hypothetical protein